MGFDLCPKNEPEYTVKVDVWNWSRFITLQVWAEGKQDVESLKRRLTHINMIETAAKATVADVPEVDFDLQEWEERIQVKQEEKGTTGAKRMLHLMAETNEEGKRIYMGGAIVTSVEVDEEEIQKLTRTMAYNAAHFQSMEDELWEVKDTTVLYGIQTNEHFLQPDECGRILSNLLRFLLTEEAREAGNELFGQHDDRSCMHEEFRDEVAEEYLPPTFFGNLPRVMGILVNGKNDEGVVIT